MAYHSGRHALKLLPLSLALVGGGVQAFEPIKFENGSSLDVQARVGYSYMKRLTGADPTIVDPPSLNRVIGLGGSEMFGPIFIRRGMIGNQDDGDRAVAKHGTISNRVNAAIDAKYTYENYKAFFTATALYDDVFSRPNDNYSRSSYNSNANPSYEYSKEAKDQVGKRARVLDAYVQGTWKLGESGDYPLSVKLGRHVVGWGEGLVFQGLGMAINPMEGYGAQIPGGNPKDFFLPTEMISGSIGLTDKLTVMAYKKFKFRPTEAPPVGSYFMPNDAAGTGGRNLLIADIGSMTDMVIAANPGLPVSAVDSLRSLETVVVPRGADIGKDNNSGQWGLAAKYQITEDTDIGLYHLRYTEPVGLPEFYYGNGIYVKNGTQLLSDDFLKALNGIGPNDCGGSIFCTSGGIGDAFRWLAPSSYRVRYMEDIKLTAASFSTRVGDYQVAGEYGYRDGAPILMLEQHFNLARGKVSNVQVSFLKTFGADFLWGLTGATSFIWRGEVMHSHLHSFELPKREGIPYPTFWRDTANISDPLPLGVVLDPDVPRFDKNATALNLNLTLSYNSIFPGWDLEIPIDWMHQLRGNPAMQTGSNSGLFGQGDRRISVGAKFTYMQNLELAVQLVQYLGAADNEFSSYRPMADRDFIGFSVNYRF